MLCDPLCFSLLLVVAASSRRCLVPATHYPAASTDCAARVILRSHSRRGSAAPAPSLPEDQGCARANKLFFRGGSCRDQLPRSPAPLAAVAAERAAAQHDHFIGQSQGLAHRQALAAGLHGRRARRVLPRHTLDEPIGRLRLASDAGGVDLKSPVRSFDPI